MKILFGYRCYARDQVIVRLFMLTKEACRLGCIVLLSSTPVVSLSLLCGINVQRRVKGEEARLMKQTTSMRERQGLLERNHLACFSIVYIL